MKEVERERGVLVGLDMPSAGRGTEAGFQARTLGQLSESEKHLRLSETADLC